MCGEKMIRFKKLSIIIAMIITLIASCAVNPIDEVKEANSSIDLNFDSNLSEEELQTTSIPTVVYLPTVHKEFPLQTIFGVQMRRIASNDEINLMKELGITWTRKDLFWTQIETNEGQYNWSAIHDFEEDLIKTKSSYIDVILVINKTPQWAREYPNSECGPIRKEKLDSFGKFMANVVNRYSAPPFYISYYEIWNEPDVDPALFNYSGNSIGCWGDNNDEYYGGKYYADMLKIVYPYVKSANPNAKVMIGGLLLDCDPRGNPSPCQQINNNPKPAKFLEGILRNNGKDYFDGISFHAYDQYSGSIGQYGIRNWNSSWDTTGPTVLAKTNYIREILAKYNASDKFLMNTESAVLCDACNNDQRYELTKAFYIPQVYSAAISLDLKANLWFSSTGWRNSGLIKPDGSPIQPAYNAYQHARQTFLNAKFVKELSLGVGIAGYEFSRDNITLWVVWSQNGDPHNLVLPKTPSRITSAQGEILQPNQSMQITIEPVYIEFQN